MSKMLFLRMALVGMLKNRALYGPYLATSSFSVVICYLLAHLCLSPIVGKLRSASNVQAVLNLGFFVMVIFSVLFLFYTHAFLIRRRQREFGLYSVLGLGRAHLCRILAWETFITALLSIVIGLGVGLLLSKFAELMLLRLLGEAADLTLVLIPAALIRTALLFAALFAVQFVVSLFSLLRSRTVDLLKSEKVGEAAPRANWLPAIAGLLLLITAYTIAIRIEDPVVAMLLFFAAVVLVILATYLLMISGSVALCRLLQRIPSYYYQPRNFVPLSTMAYRMRRNGAGMASICILCTMVLVMISSTSCLYLGMEDSLLKSYPRHMSLEWHKSGTEPMNTEGMKRLIHDTMAQRGVEMTDEIALHVYSQSVYWEDDTLYYDTRDVVARDIGQTSDLRIYSAEDYQTLTGESCSLEADQAILWYGVHSKPYTAEQVTLVGLEPLELIRVQAAEAALAEVHEDYGRQDCLGYSTSLPVLCIFVQDSDALIRQLGEDEEHFLSTWSYGFDLSCSPEEQQDLERLLLDNLKACKDPGLSDELQHYSLNAYASGRTNVIGLNGGLFFLGILLGLIFTVAAVLLLYYKQLSEGVEDSARFSILRKVGMTAEQIREGIHAQVLIVFFAPLLMAALHLVFAFPMVERILSMFGFVNRSLFVAVNIGCFGIFSLVYYFIYRITSQGYFSVVSRDAQENS